MPLAHRSLTAIGEAVDLAVIATPRRTQWPQCSTMRRLAGIRMAALITAAPAGEPHAAARWRAAIATRARERGIRLLGPGAFGVTRTGIGLNATFSDVAALPGRLGLIAQSGAVCTSMLDFAAPMGIGFSSVLSLGDEIDIDVAALLDALVADADTDAILVYVEDVCAARHFLSALRAAARAKPVVVLKAGRSLARAPADGVPGEDEVFDAALRRAGTVRVHTYAQLFAAARALAAGRMPRGERVAIVANGRGPALLAADRAHDLGVPLAALEPSTLAALEPVLPGESVRGNPLDVRGTAGVERYRTAIAAVLADRNVDAVIALHVPRPAASPMAMARAVAEAAAHPTSRCSPHGSGRPSAVTCTQRCSDGGVANFYTPENVVEAVSYLAAYRRNQQWLLEAPSSQAEIATPDFAAAEAIRTRQPRAQWLAAGDTAALLDAFGIPHLTAAVVRTVEDARAAAHALHYPVVLVRDGDDPRRAVVADARMLARDFVRLDDGVSALRLVATPRVDVAHAFAIGVHVDPAFGPVITLAAASYSLRSRAPPMLPPLSLRLARDLVDGSAGAADDVSDASRDALARVLLQVSAMVCALPWARRIVLEPVIVGDGRAMVAEARIDVDPQRSAVGRYAHMAIHPYPHELEGDLALADGATLFVRPIRPEDAVREQRFVGGTIRPVTLPAFLLPAARADAGDARALHPGRL